MRACPQPHCNYVDVVQSSFMRSPLVGIKNYEVEHTCHHAANWQVRRIMALPKRMNTDFAFSFARMTRGSSCYYGRYILP
eukprot:1871342-Amphidinium_carterae.1